MNRRYLFAFGACTAILAGCSPGRNAVPLAAAPVEKMTMLETSAASLKSHPSIEKFSNISVTGEVEGKVNKENNTNNIRMTLVIGMSKKITSPEGRIIEVELHNRQRYYYNLNDAGKVVGLEKAYGMAELKMPVKPEMKEIFRDELKAIDGLAKSYSALPKHEPRWDRVKTKPDPVMAKILRCWL